MAFWNIFKRSRPNPSGKRQQIIVWRRGHKTHTIDLDDQAAVREAERIFTDARSQGMAAIRTSPGPAEAITRYDPEAETIEFVQPIAGG